MDLIEVPERLRLVCEQARAQGAGLGFVPTMGDLHEGHASLIRRARHECGFVIVSVFVNPLQFESLDDLRAYPRRAESDASKAAALGSDVLFAPGESDMYPTGHPDVSVHPGPLGARMEGATRPGHFEGVLTVVAKLFNMVGPCRAYFGEKDAQQLALIRRMALDLDQPVDVVACPTVREPSGLALSSRNSRLDPRQREAAPVLFEALSDAATLVRQGERRADVLRAAMARRIGAEPLARLDYVAVVDEESWEDVDVLDRPARALAAVRFDGTRLIDNVALASVGVAGDGANETMQNTGGSARL